MNPVTAREGRKEGKCQKLSDVTYIDSQHARPRLMDIFSEPDGSAVDILRCIRMSIQSTICISYRVTEAADRSNSLWYKDCANLCNVHRLYIACT